MCLGGSSPPPPDYTAEKLKFGQDALADYQAQADTYNTGVDALYGNDNILPSVVV